MSDSPRPLRRSTPGGIKYALMEGHPKININRTENTATEKWLINAVDIDALARECVPPPVIVGGTVIQPIGIFMPGTVLTSVSVGFEPHGSSRPMDPFGSDPDAGAGTYETLAVANIEYTLNKEADGEQDPDDPITFLTHSITAGAKVNTFPAQGTQLNGNPNRDINVAISKVIPTVEHSLKWDYVLTPNWSLILSYLGRSNANQLQFDTGFFAAPNTVLFTGVSGSKRYLWDGFSSSSDPWELDFKFSQRYIDDSNVIDGPAGWNHVFNPKTGRWEIVTIQNGSPLYQSAPLENLFR